MKEKEKKQEKNSLRSSIKILEKKKEIISTNKEVNCDYELAAIYRFAGAGGTCKRPIYRSPAIIFNNIKNYPKKKVIIGVMATRKRIGYLLNCEERKIPILFIDAINKLIEPEIETSKSVCQEVIHYSDDSNFDLRKLFPIPITTKEDSGKYFSLGMCYASDPENYQSDVTIHRLCVQSKNELSIWLTPGRHIDSFLKKARKIKKNLPISISIGIDPIISIASCFEAPTSPLGMNELSIAGSIRKEPVMLTKCITIDQFAIANAEIVIEGEIIPNEFIREDQNTNTGKSMPEFLGYTGTAKKNLPLIKVKAVTHRKRPILHTTIGPSEEHANIVGIPTEASVLIALNKAMPGFVTNVSAHVSGGGKLLLILQCRKFTKEDEGKQKQAALIAFSTFSELKQIILVDDDVDIFDTNDVLWAMQTRYQGNVDTIFIPGVRCHPLDPSQSSKYHNSILQNGMTCKTIFDCTVPWKMKVYFQRSAFEEIDIKKFFPNFVKKNRYIY